MTTASVSPKRVEYIKRVRRTEKSNRVKPAEDTFKTTVVKTDDFECNGLEYEEWDDRISFSESKDGDGDKREARHKRNLETLRLRLEAGDPSNIEIVARSAAFVLDKLDCGEDRYGQRRLLDETVRYLACEIAKTAGHIVTDKERADLFIDESRLSFLTDSIEENGTNPEYSVTPFAYEAPTGIGKSFVILTSAFVVWNLFEIPSIISTYSKVLQLQYERSYAEFRNRLASNPAFLKPDEKVRDKEFLSALFRLRSPRDALSDWTMNVRMGKNNYLCRKRLDRIKKLFGMTGSISWGREKTQMDRFGFYDFITRLEAMGDIGQNMELWPMHVRDDPCARFVRANPSVPCKGCPQEFSLHCRYIISAASRDPLTITNHALSLSAFTRYSEHNEIQESSVDEEDEQTKKTRKTYRFPPAMFCDEGHHLMGLSTSGGVLFRLSVSDVDSICAWMFPDTKLPISSDPNEKDYRIVSEYLNDRNVLYDRMLELLAPKTSQKRDEDLLLSWCRSARSFVEESAENRVFSCSDILSVLECTGRRRARFAALADQIRESAMLLARIRSKLISVCDRISDRTDETHWELTFPEEGSLCIRKAGKTALEMGTRGRGKNAESVSALVVLSGTLAGSGRGDSSFRDESGIDTPLAGRLPEQFDMSRIQVWIPEQLPRPRHIFSEPLSKDTDTGQGTADPSRDPWLYGVVEFLKAYVPPYLDAGLGGVLVLSTSSARASLYGKTLLGLAKGRSWSVHVAGTGESSKRHIRRFLGSRGRACLIGSESFREGFDAPGKTLTWVIADRLPYERSDERQSYRLGILERSGSFDGDLERFVEAESKKRGKTFQDDQEDQKYIRSKAIRSVTFAHIGDIMEMRLRQTVGRVLRTQNDAGFFTLLDSRACPSSPWRVDSAVRAAMASCPSVNPWFVDLPNPRTWIEERARPFIRNFLDY